MPPRRIREQQQDDDLPPPPPPPQMTAFERTNVDIEAQKLKRRRIKNQQMKRSARGEATSYGDSADGLMLMTSSMTSSSHKNQQVACIPDARGSDVVEEIFSRELLFISRCYLEIAIAKRCRLHKLIRQRFALALKFQQMLFAMRKFSRDFSQEKSAGSNSIQSRAIIYQLLLRIQSQEIQAQRIEEEAKRSRRGNLSAAKQLTIYQSWMSTAELISNEESDRSLQRKGRKYCSLVGTLQRSVAQK
ncbi:hypothetical protein F511_30440 [Dorcoceras hygrometricum]|uniref:Uncharacterized protein n=1 Tax=Dorcoceras hygrometricum TaxID=472368 RepID=A0A2Z7D697_9LAMI|nr:hypothetical protein F511_30440 [Dorcoceras hygrometricum]